MEPLSRQRQQLILEMKLCTMRDLRRCRFRVRRLSRELPVFDFLWLDALVQLRKLTPFQARILDSPNPDRLRVGPCILSDQLGQGMFASTYVARQLDSSDRYVVKLLSVAPESKRNTLESLQKLAARFQDLVHPSVALPHAADEHGDELVAVSRYIQGPHLGELLVRRGRFPSDVVLEIGRQLSVGLAVLENHGFVHGDICLSNVRLSNRGRCVLVDAGIGPAVRPELSIHAGLPPERYDGTAPELIETGNPATPISDVYALGCLLWQLLAGRPPHTTGDPLAKLALHQTHNIPDVRTWAPDTPPLLAETIHSCTARDPNHRPQNFKELISVWGRSGSAGHRRISRFRARFDVSAPRASHAQDRHAARRWTILAGLMLILSTTAVTLLSPNQRMQLLRLGRSPVASAIEATGAQQPESANVATTDSFFPTEDAFETHIGSQSTSKAFLPLPPLTSDGTIALSMDGPYFVSAPIFVTSPLRILGASDRLPEIVIMDMPLSITAPQIVLENVHFRTWREGDPQPHEVRPPNALLLAQSDSLIIRQCSFRALPFTASIHGGTPTSAPIAVAWKGPAEAARETGMSIEDALFAGSGTAIHLASYPATIACVNSLRLGAGPLFHVQAPASGAQTRTISLDLEHVTLRGSGALMRWVFETDVPAVEMAVQLNDCVFDPQAAPSALFEMVTSRNASDSGPAIRVLGKGSLAKPGVMDFASIHPQSGKYAHLEASTLQLEGITTGPFEYFGQSSVSPQDSEIESYKAPRYNTPDPPGIEADRLRVPR